MKRIYIMSLLSVLMAVGWGSGAHDHQTYFPVSLAPESLTSVRVGYMDGKWTAGVEVDLRSKEERNWLDKILGDWSSINHSYSIGYMSQNLQNSITYATVYGQLTAWETGGAGVKQIVYFNTGLPHGEKLKGELTYYAFINIKNKSILFGNESEYLSFYIGLKSDHFDFQKENVQDYLEKAVNLRETAKRMMFGMYYSPNVAKTLGFGVEAKDGGALVSIFMGI